MAVCVVAHAGKEIDWWKCTLPSPRQTHEPVTTQEMKVCLSHQVATTQKTKDKRENGSMFLLRVVGETPPCLPHLPIYPYTPGMRC